MFRRVGKIILLLMVVEIPKEKSEDGDVDRNTKTKIPPEMAGFFARRMAQVIFRPGFCLPGE